jgi:hypothetical protein
MNIELESIWKTVVVEVLSLTLPGRIEGTTVDKQLVCCPRYKLRTSTMTRTHSRSVINLSHFLRVGNIQECTHSTILCCKFTAKFLFSLKVHRTLNSRLHSPHSFCDILYVRIL